MANVNTNIIQGLTAEHIVNESNIRNYEAARSNFFNFYINEKINTFLKYTSKAERAEVYDENGEVINGKESEVLGKLAQDSLKLNITAAAIPDFTLGVLSYNRGNEIVKFAGKPTWDAGSITVDDIIGIDTRAILMAWKAAAYNVNTRKGGRMADYKLDCQLVEYTQDYRPVRIWNLEGCWVSDCKGDDYDKEGGDDKRKVVCTLQYDRAVMTYDLISESQFNK